MLVDRLQEFLGTNSPHISFIISIIAVITALIFNFVLSKVMNHIAGKSQDRLLILLIRELKSPVFSLIILIAIIISFPFLEVSDHLLGILKHILTIAIILNVAWLAINVVDVLRTLYLEQYQLDVKDNLEARKVHTQLRVINRIIMILIIVIAVAASLMTFDSIRQLGVSLLASAGVVGIILGFAAQKSIATLFAGLQIALTQPIRLDDVVIVEGEWGRIEEITLTYVVVRIWDQRRLIVPVSYFIEKPFQNWTRVSADILGTVFIYTDYKVPFEALRDELTRLLKDNKNWDGKVNVLQVTNATDKTIEVRALMSAGDSGKAWDLRVYVREKMIEFLQKNYPDSLPRTRVEMEKA